MSHGIGKRAAGISGAIVLLVAIAEPAIMISPFAATFYGGYRPALTFLSGSPATAWLNGFFLPHAVVTRSPILEAQKDVGRYLLSISIWLFLLGAVQIYGAKILRRPGVSRFGLYAIVRHPQYLCLILAGAGLLTIWPRFLLLGLWVTMIFVYVLLARFEESRMEEKHPEAYREYRRRKGGFLPFSPGEKIYRHTFGRIPSRPLGFILCYLLCLAVAFGGGMGLRAWMRASSSWMFIPDERTVAISAWPRPEEDMERIVRDTYRIPQVKERIQADPGAHRVTHILPADYRMMPMYFRMPGPAPELDTSEKLHRLWSLAGHFLIPRRSAREGRRLVGHNLDDLLVVVSTCSKPYAPEMSLQECLDPGVRLRPLVIVKTHSLGHVTPYLGYPLPENAWGGVIMPLF